MASDRASQSSDAMTTFIGVVRDYLRDHPELNRLTEGVESSDRMIGWAVLDAVSLFNGTPHLTNFTLRQLLDRNQHHLLLRMAVVAVLESVMLLQSRNQLSYSAGGTSVAISDKAPMLNGFVQYFKASTDQLLQRVKVAMNISEALDGAVGAHSEMWAVNASYIAY